jgi:hypothetical protein
MTRTPPALLWKRSVGPIPYSAAVERAPTAPVGLTSKLATCERELIAAAWAASPVRPTPPPCGERLEAVERPPCTNALVVEVAGSPLYLHWAAPGTLDAPQATDDYDLFVLDEDLRNVLIASTDIQD